MLFPLKSTMDLILPSVTRSSQKQKDCFHHSQWANILSIRSPRRKVSLVLETHPP